ncbi:hypothetical protein EDD18DRAFT_1394384 [Armillaria luteobubalina]|uniref:Uncharacterized protein n=1 Tax=Armillaria luteobubalina TaxID=153913 RepID=A0AA39Q3E4_9AGAR|nr:hypothetical protein EDD18DRAFT_1394384 [Armillaria luteobubalina]
MSANTTIFAKDDLNAITEDMDDKFKTLEVPSFGRSCGTPTSEYGNSSSDSFLSRYLEQHTTPVDFGTSFTTFDSQSSKRLAFDWDHPVEANFIQHHGPHPAATDNSNHFVYFTHSTRGFEGTAYVTCRLVSTSHLFDFESVERDGIRALLSEEQYVEYLKCQKSQEYCPRSCSPPPPSVCLQPVDTYMSTGLSWEYSGSHLSGLPRAINEGATMEARVLCPSADATAALLPLPTYVSAFGTGMNLDCDYEDISQEEDSDCLDSNWDKSIVSPLISSQGPGVRVTPSTGRLEPVNLSKKVFRV